jgi:nucleotide-binding universal stress UspA family protein
VASKQEANVRSLSGFRWHNAPVIRARIDQREYRQFVFVELHTRSHDGRAIDVNIRAMVAIAAARAGGHSVGYVVVSPIFVRSQLFNMGVALLSMVIVAAVDRSEEASRVAAEAATLAEAFDDSLHIVHVISRSEFTELGRTQSEGGQTPDLDEIRETAAEFANKAAESIGVPYETFGLIGTAAEEINKYADNNDARYVVIGGRARSPAGKALFGSVSQDVLLNSTQPVLTVTEQR